MGSSDLFMQHVIGCKRSGDATAPGGPPSLVVRAPMGANATLTAADAAAVLACAVGGRAQRHFAVANMLYIGALGVMLVVLLLWRRCTCCGSRGKSAQSGTAP